MNNSRQARKFAWLSAAVLALGMASATRNLYAQEALVIVNVPFDFQQGSQLLKAGRYTLSRENEHVLHLQGQNSQGLAISRAEIGTPSSKGKLVFHVYGNRYFLREVWQANNTEHQVLPQSKAERGVQMEEALAGVHGATDVALLEH